MVLPSVCMNFLNPGSISVRMPAIRGAMAMKTSLLGSSLGILAFKYALPMSSDMTCLPSAAASWAMLSMAEVLAVGEEVSLRLEVPILAISSPNQACLEFVFDPPVSVTRWRILLCDVHLGSPSAVSESGMCTLSGKILPCGVGSRVPADDGEGFVRVLLERSSSCDVVYTEEV